MRRHEKVETSETLFHLTINELKLIMFLRNVHSMSRRGGGDRKRITLTGVGAGVIRSTDPTPLT